MPEIDGNDPRLRNVDKTCNQIRKNIQNFISEGDMQVDEFQKAISVSPDAYQRFMNPNDAHQGKESDMYQKTKAFFEKRELQGPKATPPKRAKKGDNVPDVSDIRLDGEDTKEVPVYDTCDEVRTKIRDFLKLKVSQSAFCRAIAKSFPQERKIQTRQLSAFLEKDGPTSGNTSCIFYGAYVFFEKLRIKEGQPKSQMRQEMEKIHPDGVNTTDLQLWLTCMEDERPVYDEYGRVHFV